MIRHVTRALLPVAGVLLVACGGEPPPAAEAPAPPLGAPPSASVEARSVGPSVEGSDGAEPTPAPTLPPPRPTTIALSRGDKGAGEAALTKGDDAFERNQLADAEKAYQEAAKAAPSHPGPKVGILRVRLARTGLGFEYAVAEKRADVKLVAKELQRLATANDAYGPVHAELGRALLLVGDAQGAAAALGRASALLPGEAEVHSALGVSKLALGKASEAESALRRAVELDPGNAPRRGNLGTVLFMQGKVKEAIAEYEMEVRIEPDTARARSDLGTAYLASNDFVRAERELKRAIEIDPKRATFHSNLGYAYQLAGKAVDAQTEYRKAIAIDDKLASAWINLGTVLARDPKTRKEARDALMRAKKLDASDPRVKANLEELDALERGEVMK